MLARISKWSILHDAVKVAECLRLEFSHTVVSVAAVSEGTCRVYGSLGRIFCWQMYCWLHKLQA